MSKDASDIVVRGTSRFRPQPDSSENVGPVMRGVRANAPAVVVQRRDRAARHARAAATLARVAGLLFADLLLLSLGYSAVAFLRGVNGPSHALAEFLLLLIPRGSLPRVQVLSAVVIGIALFGGYGAGPQRRSIKRIFAGSGLGLAMVFWSRIWAGISLLGAIGFVTTHIALIIALGFGRYIVELMVEAVRPTLSATSRAVVIGSRGITNELMSSQTLRHDSRILLVGFISSGAPEPESLGDMGDLVWILDRYSIDTVLIADQLENEVLLSVLHFCDRAGCTVLTAAPLFPFGGFVPRLVTRGHTPFVELIRPSLREPQLVMKRFFDICVSLLLMIVLSPLMLAIALGVRVSSRGPIFFSHARIGQAGRVFTMHKFRTMVEDAEAHQNSMKSISADDRVFKVRNDPRITAFGHFLRRTSLDELPQLWNVLRGQMSLVGPRPPLMVEVAGYEDHHYFRFEMKPGMTGPWQVSGRSEVTSFDEIIALDAAYLDNWSLARDLAILLRTFPAVLSMRGAI